MIFDIQQTANERRIERAKKKYWKIQRKIKNRIKNKISQNYLWWRKNEWKNIQKSAKELEMKRKKGIFYIQLFFRARQYKHTGHWLDHFQVHLRTSVLISAPNASILNTKVRIFQCDEMFAWNIFSRVFYFCLFKKDYKWKRNFIILRYIVRYNATQRNAATIEWTNEHNQNEWKTAQRRDFTTICVFNNNNDAEKKSGTKQLIIILSWTNAWHPM